MKACVIKVQGFEMNALKLAGKAKYSTKKELNSAVNKNRTTFT